MSDLFVGLLLLQCISYGIVLITFTCHKMKTMKETEKKEEDRRVVYAWPWERVDRFLSDHFGMSRHFFHHLLEKKNVLVNGKAVKKSKKLSKWDEIVCLSRERFDDPWLLLESPKIEIPIVHEEEDFLVINKPAWVLSHPNSVWDVSHPNVVGWLAHRYSWLPSSWHFIRAGLIHRLDKDTSGLMILVKTERGLAHFRQLFLRKSSAETIQEKEAVPLKKKYQATVLLSEKWSLTLSQREDQWFPVLIDMDVIPNTPHPVVKRGLTKILSVTPLSDEKVLIDVEILTWRTHQIRYHLSQHWLSISWDYLYGGGEKEKLQLRAVKLEFVGLDGEKKLFSVG